MAQKTKTKRVLMKPEHPPNSFTVAELRKVSKKIAAARKNRQKPSVSDGSK
jgi:hypothetical protein